MAGRISLDDAQLDGSAARLGAAVSGLRALQSQLSPSLASGAPPAVAGQVQAAVAEAARAVGDVAGGCATRQGELRRRAALTRIASGEGDQADLNVLLAWSKARMGNGKVDEDGGGPLGMLGRMGDKALGHAGDFADGFADGVKDSVSTLGKFVSGIDPKEAGHTTLDLLGLVPGFEPMP